MFYRYVYLEGLTNLVESNGEYLINAKGQVKDIEGNDIEIKRDLEGHKVVHCRSWDGVRDYRVIDLVALQFKSLQIPLKDYGKVIAFVADDDPNNTHAKNVGYRFEGGRLEVEGHPGFFYIPGMTRGAMNLQGELLDLKSKIIKNWYVTKPQATKNIKGGYRSAGLWFAAGIVLTVNRHRALCLVFKDFPNNVDKMVINHKDGVPGNDVLENLEWATRGENNTHSYVNDLKTQHNKIEARDVLTGQVTDYYSIAECARSLGYSSTAAIWFRITKCKFGQVFQDGKQFKLKEDKRDWVIPENPWEEIKLAQNSKPVLVRNCLTLENLSYESIAAAGKALNINNATLQFNLTFNNQRPLFGYQVKLLDDPNSWKDFTKEEYLNSLTPNSFQVTARNLLTGENRIFESVRKAEHYFENRFLSSRLRGGFQPLLETGWQLKYSQCSWEEIEDFEEEIYKLKRDIMARHEETGARILADNAAQLGYILKLDPKTIRQAALTRGNKVYKGYRFRLGKEDEIWPSTTTAI